MIATMALAAGVFGGVWWLWRGSRRVRPLYRRWRWRNTLVVFGHRELGRGWLFDAALAALLALAGPLVPDDLDVTVVQRAFVIGVMVVAWSL